MVQPTLHRISTDFVLEESMNSRIHFSSASEHWSTPIDTYQALDREFHFTLDPCPLHSDHDGLSINWGGHRVYCNPPYGPKIRSFLEKASEADLAVFLIPVRTDTKWFHEIVIPQAKEIRFIKGRLKFGGSKNSAPFPSMIIIFMK